jgi:hypothetical protein
MANKEKPSYFVVESTKLGYLSGETSRLMRITSFEDDHFQ